MMKIPSTYIAIKEASEKLGFEMPSDIYTCFLLRNIVGRTSHARLLELGTGTGLATSFILDGMDIDSSLISIEKEDKYLSVAQTYLGHDDRLQLIQSEGEVWIHENKGKQFDFIFADTWPGKYLLLEEILEMLTPGGIYFIDDMLPQKNWPDGHHLKVKDLKKYLCSRDDFSVQHMDWASGVIIATKNR